MEYCLETAKEAAKVFGVPEEGVLIGSTGVIGMQIPIERLKAGITLLADSKKKGLEAGHLAAKAIMTTDTKEKEVAVKFSLRGRNGSYHRRNGKGFRYDPSEYVYHAFLYYNRCEDYKEGFDRKL